MVGCSAPAAPVDQVSASSEPSPTVSRAPATDREAAAAAMQAVTDRYGSTAWEAARALAAKETVEERTEGAAYAALGEMTDPAQLEKTSEVVLPLLSGASMDDYDAWQGWRSHVSRLGSNLLRWGVGDAAAEADAAESLAAARAEVERLRK